MKNKEKYQLLIIISIIGIILLFSLIGIITKINHKTKEPTNENENIINNDEKNDDTIKVIIDNDNEENNENTEPNEETQEQPQEETKTNKDLKEEENVEQGKKSYYIKINNQANTVTIYTKDENGEYTKPVKAMICSIGTATPARGVFKISDKYTWRLLQGNVYGQYAVRITGHILFHSVPYEKRAKDTLEWWEYDKLGTKASLGCIRLTVEDAKWIYDNCDKGTQVEFYSDSNPGPLGKPTAKKISGYDESLKKWDPTDPDAKNPWKNYDESKKEDKETNAEPVKEPKPTTVEPTVTATPTPTEPTPSTEIPTPTPNTEITPTPTKSELENS